MSSISSFETFDGYLGIALAARPSPVAIRPDLVGWFACGGYLNPTGRTWSQTLSSESVWPALNHRMNEGCWNANKWQILGLT
jgi:hypothetical protein